MGEFTVKQKRSFHTVLSGLKYSRFGGRSVRFLTLTTSDLFADSVYSGVGVLNDHFQILRKRIIRSRPIDLYRSGYISLRKLKHYYNPDSWFKNFGFEYFKVETNEGNGVLHVLYRGSWLPYNFISDNWNDIHLSWDVNLRSVDLADPRSASLYVVSQYVGYQGCSYVRASYSFNWVFRGFKSAWFSLKHRFYYNPFLNKYFLNHECVDIFDRWDKLLKCRADAYFLRQLSLSDFG